MENFKIIISGKGKQQLLKDGYRYSCNRKPCGKKNVAYYKCVGTLWKADFSRARRCQCQDECVNERRALFKVNAETGMGAGEVTRLFVYRRMCLYIC